MSAIYFKDGEEFVAMDEQPYDAETMLQRLLAEHPALLAGGDDEGEANWLLIEREAGVADAEGAGSRWSLDHLFVDRDAVPTLVEVKRSSDTRSRREVVAQMLDYAANASAHWPAEHLRERLETRVGAEEAAEQVTRIIDNEDAADSSVDEFWTRVATNLEARRLRLMFVADEVPAELRRIIEFLNEQMEQTDVLALEVKQYVERGGARSTLVPRLIGDTSRAQSTKGRSSAPRTLSARHHERRNFWRSLLDVAPPGHPHENVSPGPENWLHAGAGASGFSLTYRVRRRSADVRVTVHGDSAEVNQRRFDELFAQRDEVEALFGGVLTWDPKPEANKCEIRARDWPIGLDDVDRWPELHHDMVATMRTLAQAIQPALRGLA